MKLRSLTLLNYRSYKAQSFIFHDRMNLIYGDNAQGKTNLLEAIHFLLMFKPFKQVRHEEIISFGAGQCGIKGEIETGSGLDEVHVLLSGDRKTIKLNGKIVYRTSRILGRYNVVSFLPSDLELIKGGPQGRRRYLDTFICTLEPAHLKDLKLYHRTLMQRNAVLAKTSGLTPRKLEIWDEKLAETGAHVVSRRISYIKKISPHLKRIYTRTSGLESDVGLHYKGSFSTQSNLEEEFRKELGSRIEMDRRRGHTTVGPHRDILSFSIGGRDSSLYASQGEAKNLALALKASEIELTRDVLGRTPILLLDDLTSELDEGRRKFLFRLLQDFSGQIFITGTSLNEILSRGEMRLFHIQGGKARQKQVTR